MRKKFIYFILCLIGIVGMYSSISEKKQAEDILLQNIEALATDESDVPKVCAGYGCLDCPVGNKKVKYIITGWSLLGE